MPVHYYARVTSAEEIGFGPLHRDRYTVPKDGHPVHRGPPLSKPVSGHPSEGPSLWNQRRSRLPEGSVASPGPRHLVQQLQVPFRDLPDSYRTQDMCLQQRTSVRHLELSHPKLVLKLPVPSQIVPKDMDSLEEIIKMRYTAATCDPDDFLPLEYTLGTHLHCRRTELFVCLTMYNEDETLFCRTMNA